MQNGGQVFGLSAVCEYSVIREFDTALKWKTAVYIFKYASRNPGIWEAKNPDKIGLFAGNIYFVSTFWWT